MFTQRRHTWIAAPYKRDRQAYWDTVKPEEGLYEVDCHSRLRGPYTATNMLLRQLLPLVYERHPEHVEAHAVEILTVAPEISSSLTISTLNQTALAIPKERTRFYSRYRTVRISNGIVDFLKGCIKLGVVDHFTFYFENIQAADTLDQELLCLLLRRADPASLTVVVGSSDEPSSDELKKALAQYSEVVLLTPQDKQDYQQKLASWNVPSHWVEWWGTYGQGWLAEYEPLQSIAASLETIFPAGSTFTEGLHSLTEQVPSRTSRAWASAFIESDGTSDMPLETIAYAMLDLPTKQQLHAERAEILKRQDHFSLCLGAIPYHLERIEVANPRGIEALQVALDYCINMGFYEATVDLGYRGRQLINWKEQTEYYWIFTTKCTTSLAALERPAEAEKLYDEARALSQNPGLHMQAAYATSMLYTRHHQGEARDHLRAKAWINEAIAFATLFSNPKERAFHTVFNQNGLALIENHMGNPQEALRLVTAGMERLNRELEPDEHLLHRSVLLYNRGQVYAAIGDLENALADYNAVIKVDPYYSEYHFERGNLYRKLGLEEEALADYELAVRYSPPYPEAYYNRASVLSVLGYEDRALDDYTYVLELEPTHLDALINCASLYYEREAYEYSRHMIERGLQLDPENAQLLCTLGLLEMAEEHFEEAETAFSRAIINDPSFTAAWTNRAILAYERGETATAIEDFSHALAIEENATVFYNRGIAYQEQEDWSQAIEDYSQALSLDNEVAEDIFYRRGQCYLELGDSAQSTSDFESHQTLAITLPEKDLVAQNS